MEAQKYKRVLIKISGEALAGDKHFGLNFDVIGPVCDVIKKCSEEGCEIGIVVGGGNFWRGVAVRVLGDLSVLPEDIRAQIAEVDEIADRLGPDAATASLCINYGGRDEIKNAVRAIAQQVKNGEIQPEDITEETIGAHLYTAHMPDPDLIIRPSGEIRTSNFLLWQSAYSEYYFTDVLWPDFKTSDLDAAIDNFNSRNRRFGGV